MPTAFVHTCALYELQFSAHDARQGRSRLLDARRDAIVEELCRPNFAHKRLLCHLTSVGLWRSECMKCLLRQHALLACTTRFGAGASDVT
jgi:hypothetical protein